MLRPPAQPDGPDAQGGSYDRGQYGKVVLAVLVWRRGRGSGWLAIASLGLLLALVVQSVLGMTSQVAAHVPLGVAIFGLVGTLLVRTRTLT